jgi:hypothetical protein
MKFPSEDNAALYCNLLALHSVVACALRQSMLPSFRVKCPVFQSLLTCQLARIQSPFICIVLTFASARFPPINLVLTRAGISKANKEHVVFSRKSLYLYLLKYRVGSKIFQTKFGDHHEICTF